MSLLLLLIRSLGPHLQDGLGVRLYQTGVSTAASVCWMFYLWTLFLKEQKEEISRGEESHDAKADTHTDTKNQYINKLCRSLNLYLTKHSWIQHVFTHTSVPFVTQMGKRDRVSSPRYKHREVKLTQTQAVHSPHVPEESNLKHVFVCHLPHSWLSLLSTDMSVCM